MPRLFNRMTPKPQLKARARKHLFGGHGADIKKLAAQASAEKRQELRAAWKRQNQ